MIGLWRSLNSCCAKIKRRLAAVSTSLEPHIEQIKLVFAIIAAVWILFEYRGKQEEGRVAQTLEYAKRWNSEEIAQADRKINDFIIDPATKTQLDTLKGNKQAVDNFMTDAAKTKLSAEVWKEYAFYNNLAVCVDSELCDVTSACRYFGLQMRVYLENFGAYFEWHRKEYDFDALTRIHAMLKHKACSSPDSSWISRLSGLIGLK